ncbi:transposase [Actinacidiphila soli]|uniref:transposase n=1 Tax=Actinacidiphila soli TaxID=2487275 RepID=UPI001F0BBFBC|nr:transposase [Actinacidiphila soli]
MAESRRKFDAEFREGVVRIVTETGKSAAEVARDLGINETTLASWVSRARKAGGDGTLGAGPSARSCCGCGGRTRRRPSRSSSWRWSAMSSNAAWSFG